MGRHNSPLAQTLIISLVCFLCPGIFNALNGLGGSGQLDTRTANNANTAIYATFFVSSIVGGVIVNLLGVRYTSAIACLTYALYTASYIYYNDTKNSVLTVVTGGIMGVGAGVLWTAQGTIMVSYPSPDKTGRYISIFWIIFNLGGIIGGVLPFAISYYNSGSLSGSVYIVFVVLECLGFLVSFSLLPPSKVIRDDSTFPITFRTNGLQYELLEMWRLFIKKHTIMLLPMSFASNFFYSYQFSQYNGAIFTMRTRAFNNLLYWASQIAGSCALSFLLDFSGVSRRRRGIYVLIIITIVFNVVWACTLVVQLRYTYGGKGTTDYPGGAIDFTDTKRSLGPITLYVGMGVADAWYQNMAYWIIGSLTDSVPATARYIGLYKGIQSLGAAISWQLSVQNIPYLNHMIGNWVLFVTTLPTMFYVVSRISNKRENTSDSLFAGSNQHLLRLQSLKSSSHSLTTNFSQSIPSTA